MKRQGFTLIEMLVVMGIIAILSGALFTGFSKISRSAQRAKAQEAVSNAATAFSILYQKCGNFWPKAVANESKGGHRITPQVAKVLASKGLLGISHKKGDYTPTGVDRCGVVDPWAQAVLKRSQNSGDGTRVSSGGTVADHVLYFAVDLDGDGIVSTSEGAPVDVRATAISWGCGADGRLGPYGEHTKDGADDVYSWNRAQERK